MKLFKVVMALILALTATNALAKEFPFKYCISPFVSTTGNEDPHFKVETLVFRFTSIEGSDQYVKVESGVFLHEQHERPEVIFDEDKLTDKIDVSYVENSQSLKNPRVAWEILKKTREGAFYGTGDFIERQGTEWRYTKLLDVEDYLFARAELPLVCE